MLMGLTTFLTHGKKSKIESYRQDRVDKFNKRNQNLVELHAIFLYFVFRTSWSLSMRDRCVPLCLKASGDCFILASARLARRLETYHQTHLNDISINLLRNF